MNLLFLASWYPSDEQARNGLFILRHAEALAKHSEHRVQVAAALTDSQVKNIRLTSFEAEGVTHWVGRYPASRYGLLQAFRYIQTYLRIIRQVRKQGAKPDMLVVNVLWRAGIVAWLYNLMTSTPYIIIEHWSGYMPEGEGYNGFYRKYLSKLIADQAEHILPVSHYLASSMRGQGFNNRFTVLPNVVDTKRYRPAQIRKLNPAPVLLHVSNLAPEKNFGTVIEIWHTLKQEFPATELRVAGAYDNLTRERYGDETGLRWLGYLEAPDLATEYQQADCLVMPSTFETFSIVVAEALACNCPVLASKLETFQLYQGAKGLTLLDRRETALWVAHIKRLWQQESGEDDFEFIDSRFSELNVSKKLAGIIEGVIH